MQAFSIKCITKASKTINAYGETSKPEIGLIYSRSFSTSSTIGVNFSSIYSSKASTFFCSNNNL